MMKKILKTNTGLYVWRIVMIYVALFACRVAFWFYNRSLLGAITWQELPQLCSGALTFDTSTIVYTFVLFTLLSLIPFGIRRNKIYRAVLFIIYMIAALVAITANLADAIYFHYTAKRFTADEILFADNNNTLLLIGQFAIENWQLVVLGVALMIILWRTYSPHTIPQEVIENKWWRFGTQTAVLAVVLGLSVAGARGGFSRTTRPITLSNATKYTADINKANLILSNPFCIIRTSRNKPVEYKKFYPTDELDAIYTPEHHPKYARRDTVPDYKGRNVMIVVMESFSAEHSALLSPDLYPHGKGCTPFLDSLMRKGYTFTSGYANGHKSIEALPSVLGSIPSLETPFVLLPESLGESFQMPAVFGSLGYQTMFFCGSPRGSMGFEAYAKSAGIEKFYGQEDYEAARGKKDFDGYWGIWDENFLNYTGEVLGQTKQPFFATLFTLSSHHPFVVPERYAKVLPEGRTRNHKCVEYTDLSIRNFFKTYSHEKWFRNTVFVFVADHVSSETFAPETRTPLGSCRIVYFIYSPDGRLQGTHSGVAEQIDIMPSVLHLVRYRKPYFAYGRDVFANPEGKTVYYSTSAMKIVSADNNYVALFDGENVTSLYQRSDHLMTTPLNLNDPANAIVAADFQRYLRAFVQQYYRRLEQKSYVAEK